MFDESIIDKAFESQPQALQIRKPTNKTDGINFLQFENGRLKLITINKAGEIIALEEIEDRRKHPRVCPANIIILTVVGEKEVADAMVIDMTIVSLSVKADKFVNFNNDDNVDLFLILDGKHPRERTKIKARIHRLSECNKIVFLFDETSKDSEYGTYMYNRYENLIHPKNSY